MNSRYVFASARYCSVSDFKINQILQNFQFKSWTVAIELIKHGADVNYSDKMGRTPMTVLKFLRQEVSTAL